MNVRYRVELSQAERCELTAMLSKGKRAARKLKRAQILLAAMPAAAMTRLPARWRWAVIAPYMPGENRRGRPRTTVLRNVTLVDYHSCIRAPITSVREYTIERRHADKPSVANSSECKEVSKNYCAAKY